MKKSTYYVLATILLFSIDTFAQSDKYSKGYQIGWKKGYCYEGGYGCTSPIPPLSPLPRIEESSYSYQDGYNKGFTDGKSTKTSKSSQSYNQYSPSNFGTYVQPIDVDLVANALNRKQQNYNRTRNSNYQVEVDKAINLSSELYDEVLKYLIDHENLFNWADEYQENLNTYYNPTSIINKYPTNMTHKQAGKLVIELQENYNSTLDIYETMGRKVKPFLDNPNNVLQGYYEVQSIEDLTYNEKTNRYEHSKSVASDGKGDSYLQFGKNRIVFKRPDGTYKICALKFDRLEDGNYRFQDGYGQLILITEDNDFLNYYHEPNSNGEYMKKTSYLVMGGFNFLN